MNMVNLGNHFQQHHSRCVGRFGAWNDTKCIVIGEFYCPSLLLAIACWLASWLVDAVCWANVAECVCNSVSTSESVFHAALGLIVSLILITFLSKTVMCSYARSVLPTSEWIKPYA